MQHGSVTRQIWQPIVKYVYVAYLPACAVVERETMT